MTQDDVKALAQGDRIRRSDFPQGVYATFHDILPNGLVRCNNRFPQPGGTGAFFASEFNLTDAGDWERV